MRAPKWTPVEIRYLKQHYGEFTRKEISAKLNRTEGAVKSKARELGLKKTPEQVAAICKRPNKGQFKKGNVPQNYAPDRKIAARKSRSGRVELYYRVGTMDWQPLKTLIWDKHNGHPPKGFVVRLKDENPWNMDIGNMELIPMELNMLINSTHYPNRVTAEIQHMRNKLTQAIEDYEKP